MDLTLQRTRTARCLRIAAEELLEASERASDLQRFELSSKLLDRSVELLDLAKELLDVPRQPAPAKDQLDLPF